MFERCRSPATCALAVLALAACHSGTQETVDAETADALTGDSSTDGIAAASRCSVTAARVTCDHVITPFAVGSDVRDVYWQTPVTPAPAGGYPIVLVYQGTNFPPAMTWDVLAGAPFGGYQQARLQAVLLDHGFTVIAPTAAASFAWQTNDGAAFDTTTDYTFITALLAAIASGQFGPADATRLYATGISSGGYMTSRMAVSYAGTFRALAIASASYATCLGAACVVPTELPADHPPTLFMHGDLDTIVPIATMRPYHDRLAAQGIETALDESPTAGHQWLDDAPEQTTAWFEAH